MIYTLPNVFSSVLVYLSPPFVSGWTTFNMERLAKMRPYVIYALVIKAFNVTTITTNVDKLGK